MNKNTKTQKFGNSCQNLSDHNKIIPPNYVVYLAMKNNVKKLMLPFVCLIVATELYSHFINASHTLVYTFF